MQVYNFLTWAVCPGWCDRYIHIQPKIGIQPTQWFEGYGGSWGYGDLWGMAVRVIWRFVGYGGSCGMAVPGIRRFVGCGDWYAIYSQKCKVYVNISHIFITLKSGKIRKITLETCGWAARRAASTGKIFVKISLHMHTGNTIGSCVVEVQIMYLSSISPGWIQFCIFECSCNVLESVPFNYRPRQRTRTLSSWLIFEMINFVNTSR